MISFYELAVHRMNASATPDAGVMDRLSIAHTGWRQQQGRVEGGKGGAGEGGAGDDHFGSDHRHCLSRPRITYVLGDFYFIRGPQVKLVPSE